MLFPIGDDNYNRRATPIVTWMLIGINVLVYVFLQGMTGENAFTYAYSVVPYEITHNVDLVGDFRIGNGLVRLFNGPTPIWLTILSAMFMHGGLSHIGGNMLYLWIFGDNVEDNMGRVRFLIFYLLCGILASVAHILAAPNSRVPSLGASGAIAGVLVVLSVDFFDHLKIDDPVGAISVHGVCGSFGVLSVGIFADGTANFGGSWNGVAGNVKGAIFGDWGQLFAQLIGVATLIVWSFGVSFIFFKILHKVMGMRVSEQVELDGLDLDETGIMGYPSFPTVE